MTRPGPHDEDPDDRRLAEVLAEVRDELSTLDRAYLVRPVATMAPLTPVAARSDADYDSGYDEDYLTDEESGDENGVEVAEILLTPDTPIEREIASWLAAAELDAERFRARVRAAVHAAYDAAHDDDDAVVLVNQVLGQLQFAGIDDAPLELLADALRAALGPALAQDLHAESPDEWLVAAVLDRLGATPGTAFANHPVAAELTDPSGVQQSGVQQAPDGRGVDA